MCSSDLEALDLFRKDAKQVRERIERDFAEHLQTDLKQAETAVYELQFISKLMLSADHIEEKLLDY